MKSLQVTDDYASMSERAADQLLEHVLNSRPDPLLLLASGDSPAGMYAALIRKIGERKIDISRWRFLGLDEWVGMNDSDDGSCQYHLNQQFFQPLGISREMISFFDGRSNELLTECAKAEAYINMYGPVDIGVIGLGLNGHVGMNEPGTDPSRGCHISELSDQTKAVGQKYFTRQTALTTGLTLGIRNLMESRQLLLLVSGSKKADILKKLLAASPDPALPASFLMEHEGFSIVADAAAAVK